MSDSKLQGMALSAWLPTTYLPLWPDHTYVTAEKDDGSVVSWACHGRKTGGRKLSGASGRAWFDVADCIAGTDEKAGIVYSVDGVCHQAANRILYATNSHVKVSACNGYRISELSYGVYGRSVSRWKSLKQYCTSKVAARPIPSPGGLSVGGGGGEESEADAQETDRIDRINKYYDDMFLERGPEENPSSDRQREQLFQDFSMEMSISLKVILGKDIEDSDIRRVCDRRNQLVQQDLETLAALRSGDLDFSKRVDIADQQLDSCLRDLQEILGSDRFDEFFQWNMIAKQVNLAAENVASGRMKSFSGSPDILPSPISLFDREYLSEQETPAKAAIANFDEWPNFW